ncbi:hypothetical protein CAEBREN_03969 [Caenorhabditis brenneri]|uniref:7TM GPCR serpentine receptor class x (Srx) domain-containing protein n=1 Tax=Caenorhabditis brenneri TaxID=135651 RepID=G0MRQ6_CAEBE|nr:hypothetical protein CAEBREN_03969 [Caenorhabditis brenneri]
MYQPILVAAITFLITILGTIANVLVLLAAFRMSSMSSSFGIITKNQAVCNTIMCLIFLLYVCPMQLRAIILASNKEMHEVLKKRKKTTSSVLFVSS